MKRILLVVLAVAALAATAVPALAQEGTKLGFGYFRPEAPIGGRAWINDKLAVDFGLGFANMDKINGEGKAEKKTSFCIDAGVPFVLVGDETTKFFVRPGITYFSSPVWDSDPSVKDWASSTKLWVAGTLGVEHWFGPRFSLAAGHGIVFESRDPGTKNSETSSEIMTEALSIANIGFHFYFN